MTNIALSGFAPSVSFAENTVNATAQLLDAEVAFSATDNDFDGGNLVLSGLAGEDLLSIRNQGTAAGEIGLQGNDVTFGGVVIGTVSGADTATLTITFNAAATAGAIDALIENLTYANSSHEPTSSHDLTLNITSASGSSLHSDAGSFEAMTGSDNPFSSAALGSFNNPSFMDIDGDGDLDLLTGTVISVLVALKDNVGDGYTYASSTSGFQAVSDLAAYFVNEREYFGDGLSTGPLQLSVGDADGDGDSDLILTEGYRGELYYFENVGGTLVQRTGSANPYDGLNPGFAAVDRLVDLDQDGDADLVGVDTAGNLHVWRNDAGSMTELTGAANPLNAVTAGAGAVPTFGDLDSDGDLDMVLGLADGTLAVFENDGGSYVQLTGSDNPFDGIDFGSNAAPVLQDVDGDGDADLVVGEESGLFYYENTSAAGWVIEVRVTPEYDAPIGPTVTLIDSNLAFAENDVNAVPQLLAANAVLTDASGNFAGGRLTVSGLAAEDILSLRDQGSAAGQVGLSGAVVSFGGVEIGTLSGGDGTTLVITFNADATTDAVQAVLRNLTFADASDAPVIQRSLLVNLTNAAGGDLGVSPGTQTDFVELTGSDDPLGGLKLPNGYLAAAVGDVDGDGDLDLVVGDLTGLHVLRNEGASGFHEVTGSDNPLDGFSTTLTDMLYVPAFVDIDGDGDQDLVTGNASGNFQVLQSDGAGGFTELTGSANPLDGISTKGVVAPFFADVDGNGTQDLMFSDSKGDFHTLLRDATGTLTEVTGTPADPLSGLDLAGARTAAVLDFDGDGDLDVVTAGSLGLHLYLRDAGGNLVAQTGAQDLFAGISLTYLPTVTAADVTGDGLTDLVIGGVDGFLRILAGHQDRGVSIDVTVTPQDDGPPTGTVPTGAQGDEDSLVRLDLTALGLSDPDGDPVTLVLRTDAGTLDLGFAPGLVVASGTGTAELHLTGTLPDLQLLLSSPGAVTYLGAKDVNGTAVAHVTISADDGHGEVSLGSIAIDLAPANDAPSLSGLTAITSLESDAKMGQALLPGAVFSDIEDNLAGGHLLISGLLAGDIVTPRDSGSGATAIQVVGTDITFGGVLIGQFTGGMGTDLDVTFAAGATSAGVQALLRSLVYQLTTDLPTAHHDLTVTISDGDGALVGSHVQPWLLEEATGAQNPFAGISGAGLGALRTGDADGDGDIDAAGIDGFGFLHLFTQTAGHFTETIAFDLQLPIPPNGAVLVDLYGNNGAYVVTADFLGLGGLTAFDTSTGIPTQLQGPSDPFAQVFDLTQARALVDLDLDGDIDLVGMGKDGMLHAYRNDGPGAFVPLVGGDDPFATFGPVNFTALTMGDLDGDGDTDIVAIDASTGDLVSYRHEAGGFTLLSGTMSPFQGNAQAQGALTLVDLNSDGALDLVLSDASGGIRTWMNDAPHGTVVSVDITPQNDAPRLTGLPTQVTGREDKSLALDLSGVTVTDADSPGARLYLKISASDGALTARAGLGVQVILSGADLVLAGTASALDAFLAQTGRIHYQGPADAFGADVATLAVTVSDGTAQRDVGSISVTLSEVEDTRMGTTGTDVLVGDAGRDLIEGLDGDDRILGGAGRDRLDGGAGFDTVDYSTSALGVRIDLTEGAGGLQRAIGGDAIGDQLRNFEAVIGSAQGDRLAGHSAADALYGGAGNDVILGSAGADTLAGGAGRDVLDYENAQAGVTVSLLAGVSGLQSARGGDAQGDVVSGFEAVIGSAFDDVLTGNVGANTLIGGAGADRLTGGGGIDRLTGGAGADVFVFDQARGSFDVITDFETGVDHILLRVAAFSALPVGVLGDAAFRANATGLAEDASDRVVYDTATGDLWFDADGLGGAARMKIADLSANLALTQADFLVH